LLYLTRRDVLLVRGFFDWLRIATTIYLAMAAGCAANLV